ncbi:MAG: tetratricopeptide repeat protein [SAR324 cluster bacterium]|nr:tetratricopeptide repeat protein [SAR324 cluster bacterium]
MLLHSSKFQWTLCAFFAGALLFVYWPSFQGGFLMDDDIHLYNDPFIINPGGIFKIWFQPYHSAWPYWPVSRSSLWLEWRLWGENTTGYRLSNLFLHFLTGIVLWRSLRSIQMQGAFLSALLFWFHPMQVESVAWISQRRGLLADLLMLGMIWAYWNYEKSEKKLHYFASLGLFVLALLSKSSVITAPLLLILSRFWLRKKFRLQNFLRLLPFFSVSLAKAYNEVFSSMGHQMSLDLKWSDHLLLATQTPFFYLKKFFLPYPLSFNYPKWDFSDNSWSLILPAIFWITCLLFLLRLRRDWASGLLLGIAAYLILIFPVTGIVGFGGMRYSYVADHWSLPALIPICLLISRGLHRLFPSSKETGILWKLGGIGAAVVIVGGDLSRNHAANFKDLAVLSRDTIAKNPSAWLSYYNLGYTQIKSDPSSALENFNRALAINPDYPLALNNRGLLLNRQGKYGQAFQDFNRAVELLPNHAKAYNNRGEAFFRLNRNREALSDFERALQIEPNEAIYYSNIGSAHFRLGNFSQALANYDQALSLNPMLAGISKNRSLVVRELERLAKESKQE